MFYGCSSLISIPDISKWNINKVHSIRGLFFGCSSLEFLPDISKWNINDYSKLYNFSNEWLSLSTKSYLVDIEEDTGIVMDISYLFYECSSLKKLPDISRWNIDLVVDMSFLFYGCSSLKELPDISKWNTKFIRNMSCLLIIVLH